MKCSDVERIFRGFVDGSGRRPTDAETAASCAHIVRCRVCTASVQFMRVVCHATLTPEQIAEAQRRGDEVCRRLLSDPETAAVLESVRQ